MALWRYIGERADGTRIENILSAANLTAAQERATRHAEAQGARVVAGPTLVEA